jgi:hypothetical protein
MCTRCAARGGRGGFPPRTSTEHGCGGEFFVRARDVGRNADGEAYDREARPHRHKTTILDIEKLPAGTS